MEQVKQADGTMVNADGSVTIALKYPVEFGGVTYKELTFRRPKNKDYILLDKQKGTERQRNNWLMVHLSEVAPEVIEDLDVWDLAIINEKFADFLPDEYRQKLIV